MLEEFPRITAKWAFSRCWEITSVRCLEATQFNHLFNRKYWKKELGNWRKNALDSINDTHTKFNRNHNQGANPLKRILIIWSILYITYSSKIKPLKKKSISFFLGFPISFNIHLNSLLGYWERKEEKRNPTFSILDYILK